ncbi:MAG TPA: 30S ribosomal protein S16, partial [Candidatus Tripitaka californicus]
MVRIRLKRMGRKNRPFYRIAIMDAHEERDGKTVEEVGWYDPLAKEDDKR